MHEINKLVGRLKPSRDEIICGIYKRFINGCKLINQGNFNIYMDYIWNINWRMRRKPFVRKSQGLEMFIEFVVVIICRYWLSRLYITQPVTPSHQIIV